MYRTVRHRVAIGADHDGSFRLRHGSKYLRRVDARVMDETGALSTEDLGSQVEVDAHSGLARYRVDQLHRSGRFRLTLLIRVATSVI